MKVKIIVLLLVLMLIVTTSMVYGQYLVFDSGDVAIDGTLPANGDQVNAHGWVGSSSYIYSNVQVHNGSLSIYKPANWVSVYSYLPTNITSGNVSLQFWIYDNGDSTSGAEGMGYRIWISSNQSVNTYMGMYSDRGGLNINYSTVTGIDCPGNHGTIGTPVAKTLGWHRMKMKLDLDNLYLYAQVDNAIIQSLDMSCGGYGIPTKVIGASLYSTNAGGGVQAIYYDNYRMWIGNWEDDPANIVPNVQITAPTSGTVYTRGDVVNILHSVTTGASYVYEVYNGTAYNNISVTNYTVISSTSTDFLGYDDGETTLDGNTSCASDGATAVTCGWIGNTQFEYDTSQAYSGSLSIYSQVAYGNYKIRNLINSSYGGPQTVYMRIMFNSLGKSRRGVGFFRGSDATFIGFNDAISSTNFIIDVQNSPNTDYDTGIPIQVGVWHEVYIQVDPEPLSGNSKIRYKIDGSIVTIGNGWTGNADSWGVYNHYARSSGSLVDDFWVDDLKYWQGTIEDALTELAGASWDTTGVPLFDQYNISVTVTDSGNSLSSNDVSDTFIIDYLGDPGAIYPEGGEVLIPPNDISVILNWSESSEGLGSKIYTLEYKNLTSSYMFLANVTTLSYYDWNTTNVPSTNYTWKVIAQDDYLVSNANESGYFKLVHQAVAQIMSSICSATVPVEGSSTVMSLSFDVEAIGGNDNLSLPTSRINLSSSLFAGTCSITSTGISSSTVDCNITMEYYYPAGFYDLNVTVYDSLFSVTAQETFPAKCEYLELLATTSTVNMYTDASAGDDQPLPSFIINNTGNANITNVTVKGNDLTGQQFSQMTLPASYFSVNSINNASSAVVLIGNQYVQLSTSVSPGISQELYFFVDLPTDVYPQNYYGSWYLGVA